MVNLVGRRILITVSDPWDFCSLYGTGPFRAVVEAGTANELLFRFDRPFSWKNVDFDSVVATQRHDVPGLSALVPGEQVPVNLTPVQTTSPGVDAFAEAARWRAWHLIGAAAFE